VVEYAPHFLSSVNSCDDDDVDSFRSDVGIEVTATFSAAETASARRMSVEAYGTGWNPATMMSSPVERHTNSIFDGYSLRRLLLNTDDGERYADGHVGYSSDRNRVLVSSVNAFGGNW